MEKSIRVKFAGGREAAGILKGYDPLLNLVLDNTTEFLRGLFVVVLFLSIHAMYAIYIQQLLTVNYCCDKNRVCRFGSHPMRGAQHVSEVGDCTSWQVR